MTKKLFFFSIIVVYGIFCFSTLCKAQIGIITTVVGTGVPGFSGDFGPGVDAQINSPNAIYVSSVGLVYISDAYNQRIRELKDYGTIVTIAGDGTAGYSGDSILATVAELNQPGGVVSDDAGNVYIGDYHNNRVRMINSGTGLISTIAGTGVAGFAGDGGPATAAQLDWPYNVTLDALGNLYVADQYNHRIRKINLSSGTITTVVGTGTAGDLGDGGAATAAEIYFPNYIHSDPSGNLYVTDNGNNKIRFVNASGIINTIVGTGAAGYSGDGGPATAAQLYSPAGAKLDLAGNLYIADNGNNVIRKVSTSGIITTIAGNNVEGYSGDNGPATAAELHDPLDVTIDNSGNVYIVDCLNSRIRKITYYPVASFATVDSSVCEDSCITFANTSTGTLDSVRWTAAGASISSPTSDSTSICFTTPGSTTVQLYVYGVSGNDSSSVTINVNNCTTGITNPNSIEDNFWLSLLNDNTIMLNTSLPLDNTLSISVYDATGRKVLDDMWSTGASSKQINGRYMPPGMYIIKLSNGKVFKWLKQ